MHRLGRKVNWRLKGPGKREHRRPGIKGIAREERPGPIQLQRSGHGFSNSLVRPSTLFPGPVNLLSPAPCNSPMVPIYHFHPPQAGALAFQAQDPSREGRSYPESAWRRGAPPTLPSLWRRSVLAKPKGASFSSLASRRSLRPSLFSPAPLSGVRARAGAGRVCVLQDLGGWGFST